MFLGSPRRWARPPNPPLPASTPGSSTTSTLPALTTSTTNPCRLPPALAGSPTPAPRLTLRVKPPTPQPARPPSRAPGPYPSATTTHTPLTFTDTTTNRTAATEAVDRLLGDAINAGTITAKESDLLIAYYTDAAALAQREGCSVKALECRVRRLRNRVRDGLNLA